MSLGDRTGPMGQGPMTGRGLGFCAGYDTPGYEKGYGRGAGRGFGHGRGAGRGFGFGAGAGRGFRFRGRFSNWNVSDNYPAGNWGVTPTKDEEIKMLKAQNEELKRFQNEIKKRLEGLEKDTK